MKRWDIFNKNKAVLTIKELYTKSKAKYRRSRLNNIDFSIISNNCWGGYISQYFLIPYNSPFVGMFIFAPDYIELLGEFHTHMDNKLIFIDPKMSHYANELTKWNTLGKYPIAKLGNVELHFLHYKNQTEATDKWERRKARINYDKLIVKFCDRDLATEELIKKFDELHFINKICLTSKTYQYKSCLRLKNENGEYVEDEWNNFLKTVNPVSLIRKMTG